MCDRGGARAETVKRSQDAFMFVLMDLGSGFGSASLTVRLMGLNCTNMCQFGFGYPPVLMKTQCLGRKQFRLHILF